MKITFSNNHIHLTINVTNLSLSWVCTGISYISITVIDTDMYLVPKYPWDPTFYSTSTHLWGLKSMHFRVFELGRHLGFCGRHLEIYYFWKEWVWRVYQISCVFHKVNDSGYIYNHLLRYLDTDEQQNSKSFRVDELVASYMNRMFWTSLKWLQSQIIAF